MTTRDDLDNLKDAQNNLAEAFSEFEFALKQFDKREYDRWKAGGKQVSDEYISMYPTALGMDLDSIEIDDDDDDED